MLDKDYLPEVESNVSGWLARLFGLDPNNTMEFSLTFLPEDRIELRAILHVPDSKREELREFFKTFKFIDAS